MQPWWRGFQSRFAGNDLVALLPCTLVSLILSLQSQTLSQSVNNTVPDITIHVLFAVVVMQKVDGTRTVFFAWFVRLQMPAPRDGFVAGLFSLASMLVAQLPL